MAPDVQAGPRLELVVLGAGAALPQPGRGPAAYALRGGGLAGVTLLDCGPGTVRSLPEHGLALPDVRRVVLSHFHTDHVLDLFALCFARRNPNLDPALLPELEVVGPPGTRALLAAVPGPFGQVARDPRARVVEVPPGAPHALEGGATLRAAPARHTEEAVSWRLDSPGGSLTYSGDTGDSGAGGPLAVLARGCDLLVCECALAEDEEPGMHLNGAAAGRIAAAAGARALLLSHFYPHVDPDAARAAANAAYAGPVRCAVDGTRLAVRTGSR